ncbi:MAG: dTMP kinase [Bdellovibrionales bacterium]|nr:dTMP kinase [Bdellovibrionales bacterium]
MDTVKTNKAIFVTYEGIEGAGKSTQLSLVASHFTDNAKKVFQTREPGGTEVAEKIRSILIHPVHETLHPKTELYLMQAARVQHIEHKIRPALSTHDVILCDRFIDSSTVYQGIGRELGVTWVESLNRFSTGDLYPDITFFIDIPVDLSLSRMKQRKNLKKDKSQDRFENESAAFYTTLRNGYLELAKKHQDRFIVLDGTLSKEALVALQIQKIEEKIRS